MVLKENQKIKTRLQTLLPRFNSQISQENLFYLASQYLIDHVRILGIELELAYNGGSYGGISLKIFACEKIAPHEPRLQASFSSIPRIQTYLTGSCHFFTSNSGFILGIQTQIFVSWFPHF